MTKKLLITLLAAVVGVGTFALATRQNPQTAEIASTIKLGAILHLTGDQAEVAESFRSGIELAVEEINEKGGVLGRPVEIIIEDSKLDPTKAHSAAQKLIYIDKVDAAIDASYLEVMANGKNFNESRIPVITLWDSSAEIEALGQYVFGIGIWTPSAGEEAAKFIVNNLTKTKVAIINTQNEWAESVSQYFIAELQALGGEVTAAESVSPETTDFRTVISKVLASNPEVIYTPITDGVVQFYSQLKNQSFQGAIITSDIITSSHIEEAPQSFNEIYQTQAQDPTSEEARRLTQAYKSKWGEDPKQLLFVALGYDAVQLYAKSVEGTKSTDGYTLAQYLRTAIHSYPGASGVISINEHGSAPKLESVFQIINNEFSLVKN